MTKTSFVEKAAALGLIIGAIFAPCAEAEPPASTAFRLTIENKSSFDLSPGGYVVHNKDFTLYENGKAAPQAMRAVCETGRTPDFLYFVRKHSGLRNAFSFDGGAEGKSTKEIIFHATKEFPLLSFLHKITFTDDTCVGQSSLRLFDDAGSPVSSSVELRAIDAGSKENIHLSPPKNGILAQLNWNSWKQADTTPAEPVHQSPIFGETVIAVIKIAPLEVK